MSWNPSNVICSCVKQMFLLLCLWSQLLRLCSTKAQHLNLDHLFPVSWLVPFKQQEWQSCWTSRGHSPSLHQPMMRLTLCQGPNSTCCCVSIKDTVWIKWVRVFEFISGIRDTKRAHSLILCYNSMFGQNTINTFHDSEHQQPLYLFVFSNKLSESVYKT